MKKLENSPIENVQWLDPNTLSANDYNPNHVFTKEMRLLEFSLITNKWIQPILITKNLVIVDGFHRHLIAKKNDWLVPCAVLDITEVERKLLTIRINRAKGSHIAVKMADIIIGLLQEGVTEQYIAEQIGGDVAEVRLLSKRNVFEKFDKLDGHKYSKSWIPKKIKKDAVKKPL